MFYGIILTFSIRKMQNPIGKCRALKSFLYTSSVGKTVCLAASERGDVRLGRTFSKCSPKGARHISRHEKASECTYFP